MENFTTLGVIPARRGSTRLPNKPLQKIGDKTVVERVWDQAKGAKLLSKVVVSTDSVEIVQEVERFGGTAVLTDPELPNGSARVLETAKILSNNKTEESWNLIVNIQGDMPFLRPQVIDQAVAFARDNYDTFHVVTIAAPLFSEAEFLNPSKVKVVVGDTGRALYFSRAPIPHSRDGNRLEWMFGGKKETVFGFHHFGLYIFRPDVLNLYEGLRVSALEEVEKLEQLRLLEKGYSIGVCVLEKELLEGFIEIDTPADLKAANALTL